MGTDGGTVGGTVAVVVGGGRVTVGWDTVDWLVRSSNV